ncbi:MAG TPA: hypothetical protein VNG04_11715 [Candidatus Acidoferrum sp.]|nr:hypothetical protein [Candidatus Acidoferrum sp.]HXJ30887.1 hypothetical protein [Gemmatimonadales bacterium]
MTPSLLYRIASVLLVLYAAGHTFGFQHVDPRWGVDDLIDRLRTTRFTVQGRQGRSYWGFVLGFGYFCTVLMLFTALLAWQLGGLPRATLATIPVITWGFALSFLAATIVTWRYFFIAPITFSALVTICLALAAWLSRG